MLPQPSTHVRALWEAARQAREAEISRVGSEIRPQSMNDTGLSDKHVLSVRAEPDGTGPRRPPNGQRRHAAISAVRSLPVKVPGVPGGSEIAKPWRQGRSNLFRCGPASGWINSGPLRQCEEDVRRFSSIASIASAVVPSQPDTTSRGAIRYEAWGGSPRAHLSPRAADFIHVRRISGLQQGHGTR